MQRDRTPNQSSGGGAGAAAVPGQAPRLPSIATPNAAPAGTVGTVVAGITSIGGCCQPV
jgi:hypothetical protein